MAGPLIGGLAGELGTRAPFFAAAAIAIANFTWGTLVMPETLPADRRRSFDWRRANPLGAARQIARMPALSWFFLAMFLYEIGHHVYPAIWSFYTKEAFAWSNAEIGLSLAVVGVCFAVVQGWLIRFILPRAGEAGTVWMGFAVSIAGLIFFGLATEGWMIYAALPLTAFGALITPALTGLMSHQVSERSQGELQGALASVMGVTMIISPLLMTQIFGYFVGDTAPIYLPGAAFFGAAVLLVLALVPLYLGIRRAARAS